VRRLLVIAVVAAAAVLAAAGTAGAARATGECNGFPRCVPVAGPWVLSTGRAETQWQLACPKGFVVGGTDAELTNRALDVVFRATLGSPVNPGISTSRSAVFLGRLAAGRDPAASFRPHVGCIPGAGGGDRVPTVHHRVYPPGRPTVLRATTLRVAAGATRHVTRTCRAGERLVRSSDAIGFRSKQPPSPSAAQAVQVRRATHGKRVSAAIRGGNAASGARAVVQLDLLCAGGG
jgi:hypothetical protein